ncbi:TRAP transporter small permease [Celeribacter indicus]|nr:TRAP transporter small permease [Celeribacter indicus]
MSVRPMSRLITQLSRLSEGVSAVCCVLILLATASGFILRPFNLQFLGVDDAGGFLMAWLLFFGLAQVSNNQLHIRATFLTDLFPVRWRTLCYAASHVLFALFLAVLTWLAAGLFLASAAENSRSADMLRIPLVYPQAGMVAGLVLATVAELLMAARSLGAVRRGDSFDVWER